MAAVIKPGAAEAGGYAAFWSAFRRNPGAMAGLILAALVVAAALLADVIAPHAPNQQFRDAILTPPVWAEGGSARFLLGSDDIGRDVLSRIIHGARLSLLVGAMVVALSLAAGLAVGLTAGFCRGLVDSLLMRAMDALLALPGMLLAVVVAAVLGPGLLNAALAVAAAAIPHYARLTRAAALTEIGKDYVAAARIAGAGRWRLMFREVLPNCLSPLIVQATLGFSAAILDAAALGFLGLGAQPPTPEWGAMLSSSLQFLQSAPWVATWPGVAILVTVLAFNLLGDGLRDAVDPRLKD